MRNRCLLADCYPEVIGVRHAICKGRACGVILHVIQLSVLLSSENLYMYNHILYMYVPLALNWTINVISFVFIHSI